MKVSMHKFILVRQTCKSLGVTNTALAFFIYIPSVLLFLNFQAPIIFVKITRSQKCWNCTRATLAWQFDWKPFWRTFWPYITIWTTVVANRIGNGICTYLALGTFEDCPKESQKNQSIRPAGLSNLARRIWKKSSK